MRRRDFLLSTVALPVVAALPAVGHAVVAAPATQTVTLPAAAKGVAFVIKNIGQGKMRVKSVGIGSARIPLNEILIPPRETFMFPEPPSAAA